MESTNLYQHHHADQLQLLQLQEQQQQQQQQQEPQLVYSSLGSSSSSPRVSTVHEWNWNPSMFLNGDDFSSYMNQILPNSREYFWPKNNIANLAPASTKNSILEDTHESCDFKSYVYPFPTKLQAEKTKGSISDAFPKLISDINGSILSSSYIENGHQDVTDLNQNPGISSTAEKFVRFSGLITPSSSNYMSSCSPSTDYHNLYTSTTSILPSSPSLSLATEILNCKIYDEGRTPSIEERMSSGYYQVQQSSESPSNSSNKTSTFRRGVPRTKSPKPMPSQEVAKRPRVVPQSSCPTLKVRKEKLGDRIATIHRLVSPFGKTDTASVLTEAIGYIQFLQDQIQTLSVSYLKSSRSKSCPRIRGELLSMKEQKDEEQRPTQDLRSRGLCLVPLACTSYVCSYNGSF